MAKVDITKKEEVEAVKEEELNLANTVSLTKEKEVQTENTTKTEQNEESLEDKLGDISKDLDEKSEEISKQASDMLNQANDSLSESIDNVNNGIQGFIDGVEAKTNNWNEKNKVGKEALKVEPALAAVLSVLIVGLGQMINGQLWKGLTLLGIGIIGLPLLVLITCGLGAFILPLLAPALIAVAAVDAYKCAKRLEAGQQIGPFEFHIFD